MFPSAKRAGELVGSAINAVAPIAGAITSVGSRFTNPIQSTLSDVGALRSTVAGTPLIGRSRMADAAAPSVAQLPSGAMMTGADIYPAAPQIAPNFPTQRTVAAPMVATPSKTEQVAGSSAFSYTPFSQARGAEAVRGFSSGTAPKFPEVQTTSVRDWSQNPAVAAAIKTGNIAAIEKATIEARNAFRAGIGSAPIAMQASLDSVPTAYEGRTPEQQQALLAQMRTNGQRIASNYTQTMNEFAESRGPRFAPMAAPQNMFGQPLTSLFPNSKEAIAQRVERNAPVLAATGFGAMQRSVGQAPNLRGPLAETPSLFANRGGFESRFGGLQPSASSLASSAITDEQRRNIFGRV